MRVNDYQKQMNFNEENQSFRAQIEKEITFRTSRSSGSGGQHVNKVETRVEALLNVNASSALLNQQKLRIGHRLRNRINSEGILAVSCAETRSQKRNRKIAVERLLQLIEIALAKKKIRKKTGISASAKRKRMKRKKEHSQKKTRRGFRPKTD